MKNKQETLVKKAIKGNKKAFEQLIKQHYEQMYRTAYLYVCNKEDSLDIVQEATYQAFKSIYSLKNPQYFMTWLTKIIIHCCIKQINKNKQVIPLTEEILAKQVVHNQVDSYELLEAIQQLKEDFRTALILFYYYDYSIKTISEIMSIPEGTVKTNLSRGKVALKKYLREEMING